MKYHTTSTYEKGALLPALALASSLFIGCSSANNREELSTFLPLYQERQSQQAEASGNLETIVAVLSQKGATLNQQAGIAKDLALHYLAEQKYSLAEKAITFAEETLSKAPLITIDEHYSLLDAHGRILVAEGKLDEVLTLYEQAFKQVSPFDTERRDALKTFAHKLRILIENYLTTGTEQENITRKNILEQAINKRLVKGTPDDERLAAYVSTAVFTTSLTSAKIAYETAKKLPPPPAPEVYQPAVLANNGAPVLPVAPLQPVQESSLPSLHERFQAMVSEHYSAVPLVQLSTKTTDLPVTQQPEPQALSPVAPAILPFSGVAGSSSELGKQIAELVAKELEQRKQQEPLEEKPCWPYVLGGVIGVLGLGALAVLFSRRKR